MPTRASSSFQLKDYSVIEMIAALTVVMPTRASSSFQQFMEHIENSMKNKCRNAHKGFILFSTADLRLQKFVPLAHKKNDIFANPPPLWGQKILLNAYFVPPFFLKTNLKKTFQKTPCFWVCFSYFTRLAWPAQAGVALAMPCKR